MDNILVTDIVEKSMQKKFNKSNEHTSVFFGKKSLSFGRSMIEMLGVLAVIGVLSIGGLYAYSQAMRRYKTNIWFNFVSRLQMASFDLCSAPSGCPFKVAGPPENYNYNKELVYGLDSELENLVNPNFWSLGMLEAAVSFYAGMLDVETCQAIVLAPWGSLVRMHVDYNSNAFQPAIAISGALSDADKKRLVNECTQESTWIGATSGKRWINIWFKPS